MSDIITLSDNMEISDKLANALQQMMSDDHLRRQMAKNAVKNVQRYQLNVVSRHWQSLFESIAS